MTWVLMGAVIWFSFGGYGIYVYLRGRQYVRNLPDSLGNRSLKRTHRLYFAGAIGSLLMACWYVAKLLWPGL